MCFLHDDFFNQASGGGKYKNWNTWTYDKNLLLVVDYVQKYAKEVALWIEGLSNNKSIIKKIRILLLERTGEKNSIWFREGFEKTVLFSLKYEKDFLNLQSLDNNLISVAIKYAEKNKTRISESDAIDARTKLKMIDPDERVLYFIMILEAVINNEPWRNWNQTDIVDYIVRREQADIANRLKNDTKMIHIFNRLLAFCTATKGLPVFELPQKIPELIKNEIKEISNNAYDKRELVALLQLEDGVLQPFTPDIIGEYMVLYIIDQYFIYKEEKEEFIRNLWVYDPISFLFFIIRLVEDKLTDTPYQDIIGFMLFDAFPYDNSDVMEIYSAFMGRMIFADDLNHVLNFAEILEKRYYDNPLDKKGGILYAKELVKLSSMQEMPEIKVTIETLKQLVGEHIENDAIQAAYAEGLVYLSSKQKLPEIKSTIEILENLAEEYTGNTKVQTAYAYGLVRLSMKQELPEIKEVIKKLERLAIRYTDNIEIQTAYATGLSQLSSKPKLPERKEIVGRLEQIAVAHVDNAIIQTMYARGLFNLSCEPELPEIKEVIKKLERLAIRYTDNIEIQILYAQGLVNLSCEPKLPEIKKVAENLKQLAAKYTGIAEIQTAYARGLVNLCCEQELPEKEATVEQLTQLALEYVDNIDIQECYENIMFILFGDSS